MSSTSYAASGRQNGMYSRCNIISPIFVQLILMICTGDLHLNYIEDRNTASQQTVYTASNGAPIPHPFGMSFCHRIYIII